MSKQVQRRRGSSANHANFTGAAGEMTIDSTNWRPVFHDGTTPGGITGVKRSDIFNEGYPDLADPAGVTRFGSNSTNTFLNDANDQIAFLSTTSLTTVASRFNTIGIQLDSTSTQLNDQNGVQGLRVISGSVYAGSGSVGLRSTDTNGFFHIPVMTGNPVGQLPNKYPSHAPTVLAATGQNRLYIFNPSGCWWYVNLTST